jgi:hypothetical protein
MIGTTSHNVLGQPLSYEDNLPQHTVFEHGKVHSLHDSTRPRSRRNTPATAGSTPVGSPPCWDGWIAPSSSRTSLLPPRHSLAVEASHDTGQEREGEWQEVLPPVAFPAFAGADSRLRAEALRRASAQAGRHVAVLTYPSVRAVLPSRCGLPFVRPQDRTGCAPSPRLRA